MNEFEFLAVLLSIIFGLAMTHVLTGALRLFYAEKLDDASLGYALSIAIVLIVNWWGFFGWSDETHWRFDRYLFLILWATAQYAIAATLFPRELADGIDPARGRRVFLVTMLVFLCIDAGEAYLRDQLFEPWYYLIMMSVWGAAFLIALWRQHPQVDRVVAWFLFTSVLIWSVGARMWLRV